MKNTVYVLISLCLMVGGVGCEREKEPQYEIYENHDVTACGVKDPLRNIEWLSEYCEYVIKQKSISPLSVHLLKIKDKEEYIFMIQFPSQIEHFYTLSYNNCNGDEIYSWETVNAQNPSYESFLRDKEYVAKLFYFSNKQEP